MLTPKEDAEKEKKGVSYDKLQQVNQEVQSLDVLCVIKDFNIRVGNDGEHHDKIMGKNGCGNINSKEHRLCIWCEENIQFGDFQLRKSIADHRDSQNDLDIPRWQDTHPDRSHYH